MDDTFSRREVIRNLGDIPDDVIFSLPLNETLGAPQFEFLESLDNYCEIQSFHRRQDSERIIKRGFCCIALNAMADPRIQFRYPE
jgi:hypothetical protein